VQRLSQRASGRVCKLLNPPSYPPSINTPTVGCPVQATAAFDTVRRHRHPRRAWQVFASGPARRRTTRLFFFVRSHHFFGALRRTSICSLCSIFFNPPPPPHTHTHTLTHTFLPPRSSYVATVLTAAITPLIFFTVFTLFSLPPPRTSSYVATVSTAAITHVVPQIMYMGTYPTTPLTDGSHGGFSVKVRV
jgi:hypothetical protein